MNDISPWIESCIQLLNHYHCYKNFKTIPRHLSTRSMELARRKHTYCRHFSEDHSPPLRMGSSSSASFFFVSLSVKYRETSFIASWSLAFSDHSRMSFLRKYTVLRHTYALSYYATAVLVQKHYNN
jgi:hypothetical protein